MDFSAVAVEVRLVGDEQVCWPAELTRVASGLDPVTRSARVVVRVAHPYRDASPPDRPPLQPGMLTQVTLSAASPKPRLVVPAAAVHPATEDAKHADGDQPLAGSGEGHRTRLVYRLDAEDRLRHTPVEVAFEQGGLAVIAAGLAPGDRVIVDDPLPAIDGMQVNPCPDPALEARLKDEAQAPAQPPQPAQTPSAGAAR